MTTLCVEGATSVLPMAAGPLRGEALLNLEELEGTAICCEGDRITNVGDADEADTVFDASGCVVVPGFVDCHTHLPFYGWRADEDVARLTGVRYETIHGNEGGIYRSARLLQEASDDDILAFAADLADGMLRTGTTTFESKSGYGLSFDAELRQLRLSAKLAERSSQTVVTTCLAAHAVPKGRSEGEWVAEAAELLARAAADGLCVAFDIYVETIAFALEHAARLAHEAEQLGLAKRVHADQLADNQTASFAARWGFATADHLNHASPDAVDDLAASDTVAVLLPGATFTLRQDKKPPARSLVDAGAIVALGTDLNPGTSPVSSMPFVIALACRTYGLRPLEAIAAATINSAYALGLHERVGSLAHGKRADMVVLDLDSVDQIAYRPDADPVAAVVCGGELVHVSPLARERVVKRG